MKVYTIIGGVYGTGKSSLTGVLRAQRNDLGVIVDVDRITALASVSPLEGGKMAIRRIDDWTKVFPLRRNPRCQASARRRQRPERSRTAIQFDCTMSALTRRRKALHASRTV